MHLKSLELSGFKSFAKKANLEFNTPITGIVGPNGAGKSNVSDSFRFVLGEQSIKSLRGKRGEDMIWNGGGDVGSSSKGNRASVKLIFDNTRKMFPSIDFDEVRLERIVHRDNVNEYLLNGSQVRLKDIVELLASAHIGATGHHIISQGEADRILSASIRERREMIEDALGLKLYQWKKLESLRKLERTEENMKQVESLRREIAPHIKFLKKQVEKVEKAEELRKELIMLYKEYFASEEYYLKTEKSRLDIELAGPQKELAELDLRLEKAKKILTDAKSKDAKSDEVISLEEQLAKMRTEKDSVTRELGRLEGEIAANKRSIEKEQSRMKNEESKTVYLKDVEEIVKQIENGKVKMENLASIDEVKGFFNEVISSLRAFITKNKSFAFSSSIGDAEKEIVTLVKQKCELEGALKSLTGEESKLTSDYNHLKNTIEKEKDTNRDAEKDVFKIIARQNEVRALVNNLNVAKQSLLHDEEVFKMELGEAGILVGREAVRWEASDIVSPRGRELSERSEAERVSQAEAGTAMSRATREQQSDRRKKIERNKVRLEDSGGAGGAEVMKEYRETEERDTFLAKELEDLKKAAEELQKLIVDLDARIDLEFKSGILKINEEFKKYFTLMFGGGHAELLIVKEQRRKKKSDMEDISGLLMPRPGSVNSSEELASEEDFTQGQGEGNLPEGLDVNVSLPRKKIKGLMMLSGGERALTSIALLFAVSQVNPPPFIILDETDAALDEANSRKYGDMIEDLSKHSQLILITHNRETMSRAGVLYGVTMGSDGASRLLSIQFEEAVKVAK
jgi:chromosome segregation protein